MLFHFIQLQDTCNLIVFNFNMAVVRLFITLHLVEAFGVLYIVTDLLSFAGAVLVCDPKALLLVLYSSLYLYSTVFQCSLASNRLSRSVCPCPWSHVMCSKR